MWNGVKETHFSLAASRILNWKLHDCSEGGDWKSSRENILKELKGHKLC